MIKSIKNFIRYIKDYFRLKNLQMNKNNLNVAF